MIGLTVDETAGTERQVIDGHGAHRAGQLGEAQLQHVLGILLRGKSNQFWPKLSRIYMITKS